MTKKIDEKELLENKEVREKLMNKLDVLGKTKDLILLPNTELMTTRMVAEWYEVSEDVIRDNIRRNRDELTKNGMVLKKYKEIKDLVNSENFSQLRISKQGTNVFSKRAVLNIGMLLRDSVIAKEVRTQLLNQQEVISDNQKTIHINIEQEMALKIMFSETEEERMIAINEYRQYKNRHINDLENTVKEYKPKVEEHEHFMDSKNNISMNEAAKALKVGRNILFRFLREENIKIMPAGSTIPYQRYIDSGYFLVVEAVKNEMNFTTTRVTPKGVSYLSRKLRNNASKYEYLHKYKHLFEFTDK